MSIFDSIIGENGKNFNLGDKSGNLLSALLGLITDQTQGGFAGFLNRFRQAGLGDVADSWVNTGDNLQLSGEQVESALGSETLDGIATQAGVENNTAKSALGAMIPSVVDRLTPDGVVPDESSLLSRIGCYLTGAGVLGTAGAARGGAFDRVNAADEFIHDKTSATFDRIDDPAVADSDGSPLKWLLPLILLAVLVAVGWAFCRKAEAPPLANTNVNANANKTAANTNAVVNTNANANTNVFVDRNTVANTDRKLTEVSLPDGTKLQAYPGGIEDQLIKFIQSDEYKNGTADSLKDKWFNFDDLNFKFGTTELVPESKRQLDNIAAILKAFPAVKIKIGGYTDKKGDDAANLKLSDERAKAVKSALDKSGVGAQVPEAEGYGEKFATVDENASDKEREADRKTSVRVLK